MKELRTNPERLQRFLTEIAAYGATENGGVTRLALSDEDRAARDQLKAWFEEAGCETKIDRMGNMFFVLPGKNRALPPVLTGSHCDSQPKGGRFDGILGIIGGLEVVCTLKDAGVQLERDFVVVNWTNEEGSRFTPGTTGSGVFVGKLDREAMYELTDREGKTFGGELERIGYKGTEDYDPTPLHANFEYHIEQGPVLERQGKVIGVPKGIVCLRWYDVDVTGVPNHAGTTPMEERKDAVYAFSRMARRCFDLGLDSGDVVVTVGEVHPTPNSRNVIAGHVRFTIDVRGWDEAKTDAVCAAIEQAIAEEAELTGCGADIHRTWAVERAPFSPDLTALIRETADALNLPALDMVSGASHDTVYINQIAPSAMIFVPSIDGRSHAEVEETSWSDCAAGTDVLLHCVMKTGNDPEGVTYAAAK
ncbi:Zn-dependent hydrolase [Pseudodesulfovibrio sp.]|uniref:Zn-dependent hydrolase n=1 Tax=unclassified Pseudodesulfovibrio TaxID=2661612 RepID=UPI003B007C40